MKIVSSFFHILGEAVGRTSCGSDRGNPEGTRRLLPRGSFEGVSRLRPGDGRAASPGTEGLACGVPPEPPGYIQPCEVHSEWDAAAL